MKKSLLYIFFITLYSTCLRAQPYSIIRQIGYEQGLSNNYVQSIAQDKRGYLWFATDEGLSRYDGFRFVNYLKNSPGILSPSGKGISSVLDDRKDPVLWIGTQYDGLNSYDYDKNEFKIYRHDDNNPQSLINDGITDLSQAIDGNLWICTYRGIDYLEKKSGRFFHYNSKTLSSRFCDNVWACAESKDGFLYIGHEKHGLTVLNLKNKTFINYLPHSGTSNSLPGNTIRNLCIDSLGQVWLATNNGLAVFIPSTGQFRQFNIPGNVITQNCYNVQQINANEVWVTPEFGGAVAVNIHSLTIRRLQTTYAQGLYNNWQSLSDQSLRYIFKDKYDNIWLGSWGHGVFCMEHQGPLLHHYFYSAIPSDHFLSNPSVMSITEDRDGRIWIGTDGGGINVFTGDKRTAIYKQNHPGIGDNCMQAALRDSKGNLWFGLYNAGILVFNHDNIGYTQVYPEDKQNTDVRSFYEDTKTGTLYVTTSGGLDLIDRDTHTLIKHIDLPDDLLRTVIKDKNGNIWVGSFNGGIFVLSDTGKVIHTIDMSHGLPTNTINQLYSDHKGNVWAGTSDGLICFPNSDPIGKYTVYNRQSGLDNTYIRSITEDSRNRLWITTNQSICYLQPDGRFLCYNTAEGHPFGNFTDRSTFRDRQGKIYFGSVNGLFSFNPDELLDKQPLPPVMISGLTVSGATRSDSQEDVEVYIPPKKEIKLSHNENTFTVIFNAADFSYTNRVEYLYKMKGLDDEWYNSEGMHTVTYYNLAPGTYTFIVKAHARNRESYSKETALIITITPPFYASWWAKTLYVLAIAASIWWLLRIYKNRIHLEYLLKLEKKSHQQEQELNKERLQFYTNITHELRTPLTLIIGPIEDVEKSPTLSGKDRHTISIIHQSALRLLRLINELLEFRKTETGNRQLRVVKGDIVQTVRETGLKYMELLRNPHVKFKVELPQKPVELYYDPEIITIILDNLISNAVKYTKEGSITLTAYMTDKGLFDIQVKDTGYGISADALPHIFDRYYQENSTHQTSGTGIGLALVKNLINLHEGRISVVSEEGKGSCFTIALATNATYPAAIHVSSQPSMPVIATAIPKSTSDNSDSEDNRPVNGRASILIVEDNPDILTYITGALSDNFTIHTAENGKQGESMAFELIPDIIVSDILMPEMNGYDMCKALKSDIRTSHIPIILLTAKTTMEDKMEGYEVGADSYITKPFSAILLKSRIENLIAQRKALYAQINPVLQVGKQALKEKQKKFEQSLNQLDKEFLEKITHLILDNLKSDRLDINFLADNLCMSNSTLYRKMKSLTGLSTKEYINRTRMRSAEELLLERRLSIGEIADETGIYNVVYFRQCFKKEFGVSPSEYIRNLKNAN